MRMLTRIFCLLIVSGLLSCTTVGPDYEEPETQAGEMKDWNGRLDGAISADDLDPAVLAEWWQTLNDPLLTSLIEEATRANLDLRKAQAQLRRARAQRNMAQSAESPSLSVSGSAQRSQSSANAGTGQTSELYSVGLDARWELDVFGKVARGVEAADADLAAAKEYRRDALVSVLAEVALSYNDLRTLQRRRSIAMENLKALEESLRIVRLKNEVGDVASVDVDRAQADLERAKADIPSFDQQIGQTKNALAFLLGKNPGTLNAQLDRYRELPVPPVKVAVGVPAQVLRRRPDVRAAERILAAETARVGVATAELYPTFELSGTIGLESLTGGSLFESASKMFGLGSILQWVAFDGGYVRSKIEAQNATQEEALVDYERSVLTALKDVEDGIIAFTQERIRRESLSNAMDLATRAAGVVEQQFNAGEADLLEVLDAQRVRLQTQDQLADSESTITANLIRIYKALGGGWDPEAPSDDG